MSTAFAWIFLGCLLAGVPIAFGLAGAAAIGLFATEGATFLRMVPQRIVAGVDQFPLVAIPLFVLAGELMNTSGITARIVDFARLLVRRLRGGLAQANIVASVVFAGISGSAVADAAALGSVLVPAMKRAGYKEVFAAAVTASSAVIAPIIPPSIIMVIYAYVMQVPVGALFLGGIVPGLLMGLTMMVITAVIVRRNHANEGLDDPGDINVGQTVRQAILPLLTPVIIVVGIVGGVFTPTESAAAAVVYAFLVGTVLLRSIRLSDLPGILLRTATMSASILFVIGAASLFGWLATISGMPQQIGKGITALTSDPHLVLLLVMLFLLLVGMFLDAGPAILILGPVLAPVVVGLGVDPIHFAILMCVNLTIGLLTPPMGILLFVTSSVSGVPMMKIARGMLPYLLGHLAVLFLIVYVPSVTMAVPRWFGF